MSKRILCLAILALLGCESTSGDSLISHKCTDDDVVFNEAPMHGQPPSAINDPSCKDRDPCTRDSFSESGGCIHEDMPDGAQCYGESSIGECDQGLCVIDNGDYSGTLCVNTSEECQGDESYLVNRLIGSCVQEWCNRGGPGKSLLPKPAGTPCVRINNESVDGFIESQCGPCGTCL